MTRTGEERNAQRPRRPAASARVATGRKADELLVAAGMASCHTAELENRYASMADNKNIVRFVPSHVEGLPDVEEVVVRSDQLEVKSAGRWLTFPFASIARPQEHAAISFLKRLFGMHVWPPMVGERDWFHTPKERFFVWYTDPPLRTCMPDTEGAHRSTSLFPRIHEVLASGGFATFDLG